MNHLLSFMPFARRLVPQGQDSDQEATTGAFMIFLSLNLLAAVWAVMLLASAVVLLVIAFHTPGVAFFGSTGARDAEIHSIKSVTDIGLLQRKAIWDVSESYRTGATAAYVCHIAMAALLFMIIGSIGGLLLIRWMKRHLTTAHDAS